MDGDLANLFAAALKSADSVRAQRVVESALEGGLTQLDVYAAVIAPAMRQIGDLWERGEITVADEHLASAIVERILAVLYRRGFVAPPRSREAILLSCLEGEEHQLGLRIAADVLEGAGFVVLFLGANVPLDDLVAAVSRHRPAAVGLSGTLPGSQAKLERAVDAVRAAVAGVGIVAGGAGVSSGRIALVAEIGETVAAFESIVS
jgi:MerR family transcriptional regulator, light-induced transcriptional regulator